MSNFDWIKPEWPTTENVYAAYREWYDPEYRNPEAQEKWLKVNKEEFDTWLEGVKRQAKIEALREAADELSGEGFIFRTNNGITWMAIDTLKSAAKVLYHDARKLQEEGNDEQAL